LHVQVGEQLFYQRFGRGGEDAGQVGQFVQQGGVVVGQGGSLEGG
jgi:hypothetical protein